MLGAEPKLSKGKGNQIIAIPKKKLTDRSEVLAHLAVFRPGETLRLHSGRQYFNLDPSRLNAFRGNRALRGSKLPSGYRNVERVEVAPQE